MADELDSGSSARKGVWVQVPFSAESKKQQEALNKGILAVFYLSNLKKGAEKGHYVKSLNKKALQSSLYNLLYSFHNSGTTVFVLSSFLS